ncbi:hypothetical protein HY632_03415 [Candidatus Uhrbacteria bacterium]|nr:hypothetical protein [Candidatus Uhrbacteria bacterium]
MATSLERIQQLPAAIRDLLMSDEIGDLNARIFSEHAISEDREVDVIHLLQAIYFRDRPVEAIVEGLREILPDWDDARLRALACDLLGYRLLPMEGYLRAVRETMVRLGGDPERYPRIVVGGAVAQSEDAAIQVTMETAGLTFLDHAMQERFRDACITYLRGVRGDLEFRGILERGAKIGGVGLTAAQAEQAAKALDQIKGSITSAIEELGAASVVASEASHVAEEARMLTHAEEEEVAVERKDVSPSRAEVAAAIDRVLTRTGARFKTPEAEQRFRKVVESSIRGVRNHRETRNLLVRPKAEGGLGIPQQYVDQIMTILMEEERAVHGVHVPRGKPIHEPPPALPIVSLPVSEPGAASPAPTTPIPEIVRTRRMTPLPEAVQVSRPPPEPPAALPVVAVVSPVERQTDADVSASSHAFERHALSPRAVEPIAPVPVASQEIGAPVPPDPPPSYPPPIVTPWPAPIAPPVPRAVPSVASPLPPPPVAETPLPRRLPVSAPPPPMPVLPSPPPTPLPEPVRVPEVVLPSRPPMIAAVPTVTSSGRPKVQEIRAVPPRLVGPIEELSRLTVHDFRKIAKTPAEAVEKILEKIALLEKDGNVKRAEGIRALRMSPLFSLYADILNAALAGKRPIVEEAKARHAADPAAFTTEEVQEMAKMNRGLRF